MVKLIRLTSNDRDGIFDNTFKQELLIKPNSKIALKSLSVQVENKIIIDSSNDEITFQLGEGNTHKGPRAVRLTHDEYSEKTAPLLFNDMNIKFNAALDTSTLATNRDIGVEVKVDVDATTKTTIDFNVVKLDEYFNDIVLDKGPTPVISTLTSPNKQFNAPPTTTPGLGECFLYNNINICKGGGIFRAKIQVLGSGVERHGIIGFMDTNPDELPQGVALDINKIVFGVVINGDSTGQAIPQQVYQIIKNGIVSAPDVNVNCKATDIVEIGISKGRLEARVYDVAAQSILNTDIYNFNNLFPVIVFDREGDSIAIRNIKYTPNPYNKNQSNFTPEIVDVGATPPRQGTIQASNHFLEFEGESLAHFLGFDNLRIPRSGFTFITRFIVVSDDLFKPNNLSDAFIIEMLNIGLDSYDGQTQSRASYLSVIPKEDNNNIIIYDTTYPVYIDINNFQPLSLRNIKCRVLNNDLSALSMKGLGTIVLLISD